MTGAAPLSLSLCVSFFASVNLPAQHLVRTKVRIGFFLPFSAQNKLLFEFVFSFDIALGQMCHEWQS